jgi:hypothetical protein
MIGNTVSHYRMIDKLVQGGIGGGSLTEEASLNCLSVPKFSLHQCGSDPGRLARLNGEPKYTIP